jgi:predicted permease
MLRRLFRLRPRSRAQADAQMREEIDAHVALGVDEMVRRAVTRDEAERRMRARFGDFDRQLPILVASARRRDGRSSRKEVIGNVIRDAKFGLRQLRRSPGLALGVTLSLGFGIGASATVFSWMEGLVLRPLPAVEAVDRLITIRPEIRNGFGISLPELDEWRAQAKSVTAMTAVSLSLFAVRGEAGAEPATSQPVYGMFVSANYFELLGVRRGIGRYFLAEEDEPGRAPVAVISDALWRQRFAASADIIGRRIVVNGQPTTVVGVAPENFGGNLAAARFDLWVTLSARPLFIRSEADRWRNRDFRWLDVIGRLAPEVGVDEANTEFAAIGRRQAMEHVDNRGRGVRAVPLDVGSAKQLQPLLVALVIVTGLVILLICSNVANLLLARASARHRELAVRLSIGATRGRLIRQLMVESSMLAVLGAGVGAGAAVYGHRLLVHLMPSSSVTIGAQSGIDLRFLGFVVAVTAGCVLAFGLVPALVGSRVDLADTLKNGTRDSGSHRSRTRTALVVAQFAFALTALVCAALFLRRDQYVRAMDLGFGRSDQVLLVQTEISGAGYHDLASWQRTIDLATERVAALPGVRSATVGTFVPLGFVGYTRRPATVRGHRPESGVADRVLVNGVGSGYFDLMQVPIVAGRPITDTDLSGRVRVAVVNEAFAARYLSGRSIIGATFTLGNDEVTIVGVAKNGKYDYRGMDDPPAPFVYYAWKQSPSGFVTLHVRANGDPLALSASVRDAVLAVDRNLTLLAPVTLKEYSGVPFFPSRSALIVLTILGSAALVLASMGLFSVISYGVAIRTREVGIRVALGATRQQITAMFVGASLGLVLRGLIAGVIAAALFSIALRSRLERLPDAGLVEFALPALALAMAALAAGLIPAFRAASIDPARTLRED